MTYHKTYKREVAAGMLAVVFLFYLFGMFFEPAWRVAEALKLEAFAFAMGAFGLDAVRQIRPSERAG